MKTVFTSYLDCGCPTYHMGRAHVAHFTMCPVRIGLGVPEYACLMIRTPRHRPLVSLTLTGPLAVEKTFGLMVALHAGGVL